MIRASFILFLLPFFTLGCAGFANPRTAPPKEATTSQTMQAVRRAPTPQELGSKNLSLIPLEDGEEGDLAHLSPRQRLQRVLRAQQPQPRRAEPTVIEARSQAQWDDALTRVQPKGVIRYDKIFPTAQRFIPPDVTFEPIPGFERKAGIRFTSTRDGKFGFVVRNAGGSYVRILNSDVSGGGIACDGGDWRGIRLDGNYWHDSPVMLFHAGSGRDFSISRNKMERIPAYGAVVTYNVENFESVENSFFEVAEPFHLIGPGGIYNILRNYGERLRHIPYEIQDGALSNATINYIGNIFHKWAASDGGVMGASLIAQKTLVLNVKDNYIDTSQQPGVPANDNGGGYGGQGLELGAKKITAENNTLISSRNLFWITNYGPGSVIKGTKVFGGIVWDPGSGKSNLVANGNPASGLPPASFAESGTQRSTLAQKPPPPPWPPTTQPVPPTTLITITGTPVSTRKIDVVWNGVQNATKYQVSFAAKGAPDDPRLQFSTFTTLTKYQFNTLDTEYVTDAVDTTNWEWWCTITAFLPSGQEIKSQPQLVQNNNVIEGGGQPPIPPDPTTQPTKGRMEIEGFEPLDFNLKKKAA